MGSKKESKKNRQVFVRILPAVDMCHDCIRMEKNLKVMYVRSLQDYHTSDMKKCTNPNFWCFQTDGILYNAGQDHVYSMVMNNIVDSVLNGCSAVILAHGQTGSGKSFTMTGLHNEYLHRGLVPRLVSQFLEVRNERKKDLRIHYRMSFVEICGTHTTDLLTKSSKSYMRHESLKNIKILPLNSEKVGLKLIFEGEGRRKVATSAPYKNSNQGHSVLTIYTECQSLVSTEAVLASSKLHIVDLAGVDSYGNPASYWKSREDLGSANLNKSLLEQFLIHISIQSSQSKKRNGFVNQRLCSLIQYIGDCLSPSCILRFIGHIRGTCSDLGPTLSTLRFGNQVLGIKCSHLQLNVQPLPTMIIRNLKEQVTHLSDQLLLASMLADQTSLANISQTRVEQIQRLAMDYLRGKDGELTMLSIGQATITLQVFKDLYSKLKAEKEQLGEKVAALSEEVTQQKSKHLLTPPGKIRGKRLIKRDDSQIPNEDLRTIMPQQEPSQEQVGKTDKSGISIGPGKIISHEGIVTQATKRHRVLTMGMRPSKQEEDSLSCGSTAQPPVDIRPENESTILILTNIPSRKTAWQCFIATESPPVVELQTNLENQKNNSIHAHKMYLYAASQLNETRANLDGAKAVLAQAQHKRHIQGEESYDAEGRVMTSESEHTCLGQVIQLKAAFVQAQDLVMAKKLEMENENQKLIELNQNLEDAFQNFCTTNYKVPAPQVEVREVRVQPPCESNVSDQKSKIYQHLQKSFLKKKKPAQPRKLWVKV